MLEAARTGIEEYGKTDDIYRFLNLLHWRGGNGERRGNGKSRCWIKMEY